MDISVMHNKRTRVMPIVVAAVIAVMGIASVVIMPKAKAAPFQAALVRLDRLTATTPTTGRICVTPTTAMVTGDKLIVRFPTTAGTSFVVSSTVTNWATNATFESGFTATAMPVNTTQATSVSGNDVTWNLTGGLTAGTRYCMNWTNTAALTTSSAGAAPSIFGSIKTQTAASVDQDVAYWGATIVSNDQVTVNAVVAPFFTMTLNGSTDTFATNLSTTSVNTSNSNRTVDIDTNALRGWILWVKGTNFKTVSDTGSNPANRHGALTSITAGGYAISNNTVNALASPAAAHTFTPGSEDYGLAVTINAAGTGAGTTSLNAAFNGTTSNNAGVIDPTQYRSIASSNGTAENALLNIRMLVTIDTTTPPGADYTDTLTYVGAGQF